MQMLYFTQWVKEANLSHVSNFMNKVKDIGCPSPLNLEP